MLHFQDKEVRLTYCGTKGLRLPGAAYAAVAMIVLLAGCGEFKLIDKKDFTQENDPREDIRLTQVSADLTSGGLVQHRVKGSQATFSQARNILVIKDVAVNTYDTDGTTQGITQARIGEVFLAADPATKRNRNDMRFAGNVRYRSPDRNHPETDTLQLRTDQLIYNDATQKFEGQSTHTVVMMPPGKRPLFMTGSQLRVPRDLSRFDMMKGSVGPVQSVDTASSFTQLTKELERLAGTAAASSAKPPVRPPPIQVQEDAGPPERPELPTVPAIAPSPTPVPPAGVLR